MKNKILLSILIIVSLHLSFALADEMPTPEELAALEAQLPTLPQLNANQLTQLFSDSVGFVYTCPETKAGIICQEFPSTKCSELCAQNCIPSDIKHLPADSQCYLGVCYDPIEGTCSWNSPKSKCGGMFLTNSAEIQTKCKKGCCQWSHALMFVTEKQCRQISDTRGLTFGTDVIFDNTDDEPTCLSKTTNAQFGACVLGIENEKNQCKWTTQDECYRLTRDNTKFSAGVYCSGIPNSACVPKGGGKGCVENSKNVYWLDSCNNPEDISLTCDPGQTCAGLSDGTYDCKDLGCVDIQGNRRQNGESWCAYQSSIGLPDDDSQSGSLTSIGDRATDTPGSRHFRVSCINGEIITSPCENFRNEICVEEKTPTSIINTFSRSTCRKNRWQECLDYNHGMIEARLIGMLDSYTSAVSETIIADRCNSDPDCFMKKITIGDTGFSYCLPRYPPGFSLNEDNTDFIFPLEKNEENAEGNSIGIGSPSAIKICSQASQECKVKWAKNIVGGWECVKNCECIEGTDPSSAKPSADFVKTMNEFCTSLGDCGHKTNYKGTFSVQTSFDPSYDLGVTSSDADPTVGEYIPAKYLADSRGRWLTVPRVTSIIDLNPQPFSYTTSISVPDQNAQETLGFIKGGKGIDDAASKFSSPAEIESRVSPTRIGFDNALTSSGSSLGLGPAAATFLIDITSLGTGNIANSYAFIGRGAVGGSTMALNAIDLSSLECNNPVSCILAFAMRDSMQLTSEEATTSVNFDCSPWRPPEGSDEICSGCGNDRLSDGQENFPCNKYSCETLGNGCKFVTESEGPNQVGSNTCIYVPQTDTTPPSIIGFSSATSNIEIVQNPNGEFTIAKSGGDQECINELDSIKLNFKLNENGKCRISALDPRDPAVRPDQMNRIKSGPLEFNYKFNSKLLPKLGHTQPLIAQQRSDVKLFMVCEDYGGSNNKDAPFIINFCIIPRITSVTAVIEDLGDLFEQTPVLGCNAQEKEISFIVQQPSECRWSDSDKTIAEMPESNKFDCTTQTSMDEYECKTRINLGDQTNFPLSIRCRTLECQTPDCETSLPQITLSKTTSCLSIDSVKINDNDATEKVTIEQTTGQGLAPIKIELAISGGFDGTADCSLTMTGQSSTFKFTDNIINNLQENIPPLADGEYTIQIKCIDAAQNLAEKTAQFKLQTNTI